MGAGATRGDVRRGGMISVIGGIRCVAGRGVGGLMDVAGRSPTGGETTIRRVAGVAVLRCTTVASSSALFGTIGGAGTRGRGIRVTLGSGAPTTLGSGACGVGRDMGSVVGVGVGCVSGGRPRGGRSVGRLAGSMVGAGAGVVLGNGGNPGGG